MITKSLAAEEADTPSVFWVAIIVGRMYIEYPAVGTLTIVGEQRRPLFGKVDRKQSARGSKVHVTAKYTYTSLQVHVHVTAKCMYTSLQSTCTRHCKVHVHVTAKCMGQRETRDNNVQCGGKHVWLMVGNAEKQWPWDQCIGQIADVHAIRTIRT
jgi:hypothetical protein